jgi:KDO2-lipid IV(A) lauroyltransferase
VHVLPTQAFDAASGDAAVVQMNQAVEALISQHPGQYLWGYARYKQPRADLPPGAEPRPQPPTAH